jgi:tetratricopeptide (TPR) repeat protein
LRTGHLSDAELDKILGSGGSAGPGELTDENIAHCRECSSCAEAVKNCLATNHEIQSLKELNSSEPLSQCPSDEMWLKVVAGIVDEIEATKLLQHAAECSTCAALLERATAYFADEPVRFPGLKSGDPEWQLNIAEQMALARYPLNLVAVVRGYLSRVAREPQQLDSQLKVFDAFPVPEAKRFNKRRFWLMIPSSLSALVLIVVALLLWPRPKSVEQLLGQAYAENRSLELRFSGALYGPVRTRPRVPKAAYMSSTPSPTPLPPRESPALLEARPIISRKLREQPNSPRWLDAKGRADLLEGNYDAAIQSFQRALEIEPDSAFLQTDLASAYFERGRMYNRPQDCGRAIEFLGKALGKRPDDPIALYNRALVSETMSSFTPKDCGEELELLDALRTPHDYTAVLAFRSENMRLSHQAFDDWTRYLQIDPTSEWTKEATSHLNAMRQRQEKPNRAR